MVVDESKDKLVKLVECPRDAMQGWPAFIPTEKKITYLNALLQVGFDSLDFGSFVSPKAIPQMADTKQVLPEINPGKSTTRLLAIVANARGAEDAGLYPVIRDIGFPFSISETFQKRNTNSSIGESVKTVSSILEICRKRDKRLVIYISMAFGNPYGDEWSADIALHWIRELVQMGAEVISLADTVGLASPGQVHSITKSLIAEFPFIEAGVHLHSRREKSIDKLEAAFSAGCRRFDGALNGIGGCPMAGDELVGNMDSLLMIDYFKKKHMLPALNESALEKSTRLSAEIFLTH
jgi:hydroxymethylglutaryl-CoA lyase